MDLCSSTQRMSKNTEKPKYIKLLQQKFKLKNIFIDPFFDLKDNFELRLRLKNNFYTQIFFTFN